MGLLIQLYHLKYYSNSISAHAMYLRSMGFWGLNIIFYLKFLCKNGYFVTVLKGSYMVKTGFIRLKRFDLNCFLFGVKNNCVKKWISSIPFYGNFYFSETRVSHVGPLGLSRQLYQPQIFPVIQLANRLQSKP